MGVDDKNFMALYSEASNEFDYTTAGAGPEIILYTVRAELVILSQTFTFERNKEGVTTSSH